MNTTKQKGLVTELLCQLDFSKLGILLSAPITEDSRYDFIADVNGNLIRIQCKTCSVTENGEAIEFATRSIQLNSKRTNVRTYSKKEIDYFYTSYVGQGYLIPVEKANTSYKILRLDNTSHVLSTMDWARNYKIQDVLAKDFNYDISEVTINVIKKDFKQNICPICGRNITTRAKLCA